MRDSFGDSAVTDLAGPSQDASATLRGGETHHRAIVESAIDVAILTTDVEGTITSWNSGAVRLLGWSKTEAVGMHASMIFIPEDLENDAFNREMQSVVDCGSAEVERWHRRKDGSRFRASGSLVRFEDAVHSDTRGFLRIVRDTTSQHQLLDRLGESETLARALFESSADCVKLLDLDGRLHSMNGPGMCLMEIYDFCSFVGQEWVALWPEDLQGEVRSALADAQAGRVGRFSGACPTAKGTAKWWDVQVSPVRRPDGTASMLLSVSRDMTERMQGLEALAESEARFRNMADNTPLMMWITDLSGSCTYLNRRWFEFTGQSEEEALGFGWLNATHPDDKAKAENAFLDANARQEPFRFEYRLRRADGSYHWAIDAASPRFAEDGTYLGYIGSVIDIEERRRVELALQETSRRLDAILNNTREAVFLMDERQQCVFANAAAEKLTGYSFDQMRGRPLHDVVHHKKPDGSHYPLEECPIDRAFPERAQTSGEELFVAPDGSFYPVAFTASPVLNEAGQPIGTVIEARDITEERARDQALRQSETRLRELNATLEAQVAERTADRDRTWRLAQDLFVVAEPSGALSAVNHAWTDLLGWNEHELLGVSFVEFTHPEDLEATLAVFAKVFDTPLKTPYEYRLRHKDGTYRWFAWTATFEAGRVYATGRHTTAERQQAEALHQAEEQLRQAQKMEAVGQLTGGIAHDFNNLLTGVIGSLDMMQRRIAKGETASIERYATAAMTSANRAAALTHRLLAFSRRQPLDPKPTNANRLVTGMEELLRRTIGEAIRLEMVTAGGLWQTLCDPHQLESAILNLAINARDAMPTGGTLTIETCNAHLDSTYTAMSRGVRPGQYVCVCVTDTGTGMTPDVIAKAFDPFFTTKPIGQGTGLGLSMIYGFAQQSEGYAKIYSEVNKGTTFKLYLPRYYGEGNEAEEASATLSDQHRAANGEVVLVVEDETAVRDLVVEVLHELGFNAVEASDGPSGLKLLQSDMRVDLVVTDVGLPGLNGRQLADAARVHRPGLKILFMTGYAENAAIANGFLEHGMQMITKPFAIEALATRIRDIIEHR